MKRVPLARLGIVGVVFLFMAPAIAWLLRGPGEITFNVTVQTERVRYRTDRHAGDSSPPPRLLWVLENVLVEENPNEPGKPFTGYFEPAHPVDVIIERVATGPLYVEVSSLADSASSVGRLLDAEETPVDTLGAHVALFIRGLATRADSGATVVLPLTGQVEAGVELGRPIRGTTAILRSGQVRMLGRSILGDDVFEAGRAELDAGDHFTVEDPEDESLGFVVADQRPGLTAAYRSVGTRGRVTRPGGGNYPLQVSFFQQLRNDHPFRIAASVLGGLVGLATIFNFLIDWIAFRRGSGESRPARIRRRPFRAPDRTSPMPPPEPVKAPPTSSPAAGSVVKGALALFLAGAGSAQAQTGVFVNAGEQGQGILRRRAEACFVILPHHVVASSGGEIGIVGERGRQGVAVLDRTFPGDLAMLRLQRNELQCSEWLSPFAAALLRQWGMQRKVPSGTTYLRIIEESGSETRLPVDVRSMDDESITIHPRAASDAISQTMSGASLMASDTVLGILLRVCPAEPPPDDTCTPGDGDVLRIEAISSVTDAFFDVPNPTVQAAIERQQQQEAQGRLDVERVRDSLEKVMRETQASAAESMYRQIDSARMAQRGGRPPDLPRLLRDVDDLFLFGSDQRITFPCGVCTSASFPTDSYGPYLYVALRLSEPVKTRAPTLPAAIASCTLRSSAGRLGAFGIRTQSETIAAGLAWGDRSKPLPAGEYWAECRIDGIEFESNRLRLLRSTSAAGDLALGDGRTANVTGVEIGFEGMALARLALPADTALRIEMPRPRRPDAPIAIVFHIEQVTGQPLEALPAAIVRRMTCVGEFMAREPPTVEPFRPGVWQVTRILAPVGSRWRPGEYEAGCQVFQMVLAIR